MLQINLTATKKDYSENCYVYDVEIIRGNTSTKFFKQDALSTRKILSDIDEPMNINLYDESFNDSINVIRYKKQYMKGGDTMKIDKLDIKCDFCHKDFKPYKLRKDGTPNGIRLLMKDDSFVTACHDCICDEAQYSKLLGVVNHGKIKPE